MYTKNTAMATPPRRRGRPKAAIMNTVIPDAATPGAATMAAGNAAALLSPLEPVVLSTRAAERLRDLIVQGHLAPGQLIAEESLSTALGISRTPLREALRQLTAQGLILLRPNRGAQVAPLDAAAISALFETLAGVERFAAELAAERATEPDLRSLASLQAELRRQRDANRLSSYFEANQRIHLLIVRMAANPVLSEVHATLFPRAERGRFLALEHRGRWDESIGEHEEILDALRGRDPRRAGALLAAHVAHTGEAVLRGLAARNAA